MSNPSDTRAPELAFGRPALEAPSGVYVTGEDNLRVQSYNAASGVTLLIGGRFLDCDGKTRSFQFTQTANTDRTVKSSIFPLGTGWIQNLYVISSAGSPLVGQTFVLVQLVRGLEGAVTELATLLQGVVTATQRLAWPGSPVISTIASPGNVRLVTGTNPAVGVEITETVPTGARWEILSMWAELACDATAASRRPCLVVDDGTNEYFRSDATGTSGAFDTSRYIWAAGSFLAVAISGAARLQGIPQGLSLLAGHRVRTETASFQAGDNYAAPRLLVREQIEGA